MKKKLVAVVVVMAMVCMMLTGCGKKAAPADQTISALFDLCAKNDPVPMKELLGFETEEGVYEAFYENGSEGDLAELMKEAIESAGVEMTEEETQEFIDSMQKMIDKVSCTAEITSQEKDSTVVTLQVTGYSAENMMDVMMELYDEMMASITEEDLNAISMGDEELYNTYMKQFLSDFMTALGEMETEEEPVEVEVECEMLVIEVNGEEQIEWLPVDLAQFEEDVNAAVMQE